MIRGRSRSRVQGIAEGNQNRPTNQNPSNGGVQFRQGKGAPTKQAAGDATRGLNSFNGGFNPRSQGRGYGGGQGAGGSGDSLKRTYASLLNSNPLEHKLNLSYVEPNSDGSRPYFRPADAIIEEASRTWRDYLVGYFVSDSMEWQKVALAANGYWGKLGLEETLEDASGFFFFKFPDAEMRRRVLEGGPWLFSGKPMILQQWEPAMVLCKISHSKLPLWIRIHKVPLALWTAAGLSGIASLVGKPLYADSYTEKRTKIAFARICVEVDATKPLVDSVLVKMGDEELELDVDYQWRPAICDKCKVFGHSCGDDRVRATSTPVRDPIKGKGPANPSLILDEEGFTLVRRKRSGTGIEINEPRGGREMDQEGSEMSQPVEEPVVHTVEEVVPETNQDQGKDEENGGDKQSFSSEESEDTDDDSSRSSGDLKASEEGDIESSPDTGEWLRNQPQGNPVVIVSALSTQESPGSQVHRIPELTSSLDSVIAAMPSHEVEGRKAQKKSKAAPKRGHNPGASKPPRARRKH